MFAAVGWLYIIYAALLHGLDYHPPVCVFLELTGIRCPLCGLTRAFGFLLAGDLETAFLHNRLSLVLFPLWVVFTGINTIAFWRSGRAPNSG